MDDVASWSQSPEYAEHFGRTRFPDERKPSSMVTPHEASGVARPQVAVLALSTPALLAEADDDLVLRMCRRKTTSRDVLLVQALAARLKTAVAPVRGREALDGALWLDLGRVA
jgi:hypothetical protein